MTGALRSLARGGCALALALALALGAAAQTAPDRSDEAVTALKAAERLQAAAQALAAAERARDRVAALTATIAAFEEGLSVMRDSLRRATLREATIARRFEARSAELSQLLGVLVALERTEGPLLLLHPGGALGTARSGMLLSDVTPALAAEAAAIRTDLEEIAAIREGQQAAAAVLQDGMQRLQAARIALSRAIADREPLPQRLTDDPEALQLLLSGAETLDAFAAGLAALPAVDGSDTGVEAGAPVGRAAFEAARGQLPLPVQASVLRRAGEADAAGIRRPGLVLATRPRALVTAPFAATIRYRGPLLDYGNVMVLEPAEGYLLVLAGLDGVYGGVGEVVAAGTAVGIMGGDEPRAQEFLASATQGSGERSETLYVELRRETEPVNPEPWFAQTRE